MAVLLAGLPGELSAAIAGHLRKQGDEVRAVATDPQVIARLKPLGVKIARGDADDPDLVAAAATGARTVVTSPFSAAIAQALEPTVRYVVICPRPPDPAPDATTIFLVTGKSRFGRARVSIERIAEAVDAADDRPDVEGAIVDLTRPGGGEVLGL